MKLPEIIERNARRYPRREALVQDETRLTHAELAARVEHTARCLAGLGLNKGDRILVQMNNQIPYVELYFAAPLLGIILVPLNVRLTPAELPYFIAHSQARCLIADLTTAQVLNEHLSNLDNVEKRIVVGGVLQGWRPYHFLEPVPSWQPPPYNPGAENDVAYLFYTSGTTGRPKGAMWTNRQVFEHLVTLQIDLPLSPEDSSLVAVNLSHGPSTLPTLHQVLFAGGRVVLYPGPKFLAEKFAEMATQENATTTLLVPTMLTRMLRLTEPRSQWFHGFKYIKYAAAKMPAQDLQRAVELMGTRLTQGYGSTETVGGVTFLSPKEHDRRRPGLESRLASAGREYCNVRVAIMDEDGCILPPGEVGQIVVRSDKNFAGYWNDREATVRTFWHGWLLTGDLGRLDDEGYLYVVDRISDMIISGGENVYPMEVENIITGMAGVADCAVVGVVDPEWGEAVWAFIVPEKGQELDLTDCAALCRRHLAGYKRPKHWKILPELPRNLTGKIQKNLLKEQALKILEKEK